MIQELFDENICKIWYKKYDAKDLLNNYLVKDGILLMKKKNTEILENFITIFINNNMTKFIWYINL